MKKITISLILSLSLINSYLTTIYCPIPGYSSDSDESDSDNDNEATFNRLILKFNLREWKMQLKKTHTRILIQQL